MSTKFRVWGGVFRSVGAACAPAPQRSDIIEAAEEYGPFETEEEADRIWLGQTRRKIDIAAHRLVVEPVQDERLPGLSA